MRRTYIFWTGVRFGCDDIMHSRMYTVVQDGSVIRYLFVLGTSAYIRQRISRTQCAREMVYLRAHGFDCTLAPE
jgi:hypothetical protein